MDPNVKQLWLTALRSGDYAQGRGALHRITADGGSEYCCLGVLCALAADAGHAMPATSPHHDDDVMVEVFYDGARNYLPSTVLTWAGLTDIDPLIDRIGARLSQLNDMWSYRIAALVEAEL